MPHCKYLEVVPMQMKNGLFSISIQNGSVVIHALTGRG
jgi:hypothetical protein